jgi:hypothetical protein
VVDETSGLVLIVLQVTSAAGSKIAMTGPFAASISVGGAEVRGALAELPLDSLRACEPVWGPGVYRRQRHMPRRWFSTTIGGFLEYESLLERDWMLLMDFDREVEWIWRAAAAAALLRGRSAGEAQAPPAGTAVGPATPGEDR